MNATQKLHRVKQVRQMRADADAMAIRADLQARREAMICSVAETVALDWYKRCVRSQQRMTLFWRKPREGEKAACPIIDVTVPNEDFQAHCEIIPSMSRDRVRSIVAQSMRDLPILSLDWFAL